jgi:pyrroloquinoline quinone biosynthesis protein B
MKLRVLGSAAGGGFPQWNCHCRHCTAVRAGAPGYRARTQSSIAVGGGADGWVLVNASPDVRAQLLGTPELQTPGRLRGSAIAGVVLIDAQVDHVTGLLLLRESNRPLPLYCTARVRDDLSRHFPVMPMLGHYCGIDWHEIATEGQAFQVTGAAGIAFQAVPLTSKAPPYSPHRADPAPGDTDVILVDGTCWQDDELIVAGVGRQTARAMGHLPQSGAGGMIEALAGLGARRRILIHINNTNPILDEGGAERSVLAQAGIEVACDGQLIEV